MLLFEAKQLLNFVGLEVEALWTYEGCSLIFVLIFGLTWSHGYGVSNPVRFNRVGEVIGLDHGVWVAYQSERRKKKVYGTYLEMIV